MPKLDHLKQLCEKVDANQEINPEMPSWCMVNYLLLKDSGCNIHPGAVVAASAECTLFSYTRESISPMYFNTIGGDKRFELISGYSINSIRTDNVEKAFQFIKNGIDSSKGIFISGPEISICYGYEDDQNINNRILHGIAHWGPGLYGEFSWDKFSHFIKMFGNNEGLKVIDHHMKEGTKEEIVEMIIETAIDWQENHPAINYGQKKENYGLTAFQQFIYDLSNRSIRDKVDEAYLNCHVIMSQMGGRYWLGSYLKELADQFKVPSKITLNEIGNLYIKSSELLKQFIDFNIKKRNEKEIPEALAILKEAYNYEKEIAENFRIIRELLN
jgi:hypothetical protein